MVNQRFVRSLSPEEASLLKRAERDASNLPERNRCRAVLLSAQHWTVPHIATALDVCPHTVRRAIASFERGGRPALCEHPRPGRPAKKWNHLEPG